MFFVFFAVFFLSVSLFLLVRFHFYHSSWVSFVWFFFFNFFVLLLFVFVLLFVFFWFVCFLFLFFPFFLFLWPLCAAWGLLVPWPGVGSGPPGWESQVQDAGPPENSVAQGILIGVHTPRGIYINNKTQPHTTACRLQCWTPHAKQPARQEDSSTNKQTGCLKSY